MSDLREIAYFRPGTGTWATYPHKGLYYSADRNGVYVLRLTVQAGEFEASSTAMVAMHAAATPEADPEEEALAALERPHGGHCTKLLPDL